MCAAPIITLTINPSVDISSSVEQVTPDSKLRCAEPLYEAGGGGLNVSRVVRELGGDTLALWAQGGFSGDFLHALLDAAGLPHRALPMAGANRENFVVTETGSGRQFRFVMPGPVFAPAEVDACIEHTVAAVPDGAYLVLSGSLAPGVGEDFYARIITRLEGRCRIVLDTSGEALRTSLQRGVFMVKPNLRELAALAGVAMEDDAAIEAAVRGLVDSDRAQVVLASLGAGGAIVASAEGIVHLRAPTVPIRSRVGAGDSMVAAATLALARGEPVERAARYGVAAGSAAVMTPGTGLCSRLDVERLFA